MKKIFFFTLTLLFFLLSCFPALAHPGRTDSSGGHYDRSTGEYHYHHGYSAHQHINGECPYDFKDKTNSSSSGKSSNSNNNSYTTRYTTTQQTTTQPTTQKEPISGTYKTYIKENPTSAALMGIAILILVAAGIYILKT